MSNESEDRTTKSWMKEAQKGYIRMGLLILINRKPSHGYEIMKEINNRTKGYWTPTPGGVYPILRDLEKSGYIKGQWETQKNRKLKVYKITKSGQTILKHAIVKQAEIFNSMVNLFQEFARDVLNIEADVEMPEMPSMFSPFLEEKPTAQDLKLLERQRVHMLQNLKISREKLKTLDRRIVELRKSSKTGTTQQSQ
jgi:DNA-binding PadR family transcriptional regulator